jgi:hypothetical protein
MRAIRSLKITLELTEHEASELYLHINPKYVPNQMDELKAEISAALGYKPTED